MAFGYHLTSRNAALKIKIEGLRSNEMRLGVTVANPNGAFALNRAKREPGMQLDRLKRDVACLVFLDATKEELLAADCADQPITDYQARGIDPSADLLDLDRAATAALIRFKDRIPKLRNKSLVTTGSLFSKCWRGPMTAKAAEAVQARQTHYLRRLAVQFTAFHYRVEELQTSTHVYFSQPQDAVALYGNYKKHLGADNPLVILRVDLDEVAWTIDEAQGGAIKVKNGVPASKLRIMEHHDRFVEESWRGAEGNWAPLTAFAAAPLTPRPRAPIGYGWPAIDR